jgi:hypothetical protein
VGADIASHRLFHGGQAALLPENPRIRFAPILSSSEQRIPAEAGAGPPRGVIGPRRGDIQVERQRPRAAVRDQRTRRHDLQFPIFLERAAVLAMHALHIDDPTLESNHDGMRAIVRGQLG